jgi:hypothetical protein
VTRKEKQKLWKFVPATLFPWSPKEPEGMTDARKSRPPSSKKPKLR